MKDADIAFQLLTTDEPAAAQAYVEELEQLNQARQRQTEELMQSVRIEAQPRQTDAIVLVSGENWPEGIIGLVAGKISEEVQRPPVGLSRRAALCPCATRTQ